jgi:hypothetical protein
MFERFYGSITILTALGITVVVSVVEGGILMVAYRRNLAITVYGFPMEQPYQQQ